MSVGTQEASTVLEGLLAAVSIVWSLQLQLIWRAFDTVEKPRATANFLMTLLFLGATAISTPLIALVYRAFGSDQTAFEALFWLSIGLGVLFLLVLLIAYVLLILLFRHRKGAPPRKAA